MTISQSVEKTADQQFIDLVWKVFFLDKERGINLACHFPWIHKDQPDVWYIFIRQDQKVIAGLVVKEFEFKVDSSTIAKVGAVGLVCVDNNFRGQGLSKKLLSSLITESKARNLNALTLWTSKHEVYKPYGFILHDDASFGWINICNKLLDEKDQSIRETIYRRQIECLPPFALDGYIYYFKSSKIRVIEDKKGLILVDWIGELNDVQYLILKTMPLRWRMNSFTGDRLVDKLKLILTDINLIDSNLQMWCLLDERFTIEQLKKMLPFSLFERI